MIIIYKIDSLLQVVFYDKSLQAIIWKYDDIL